MSYGRNQRHSTCNCTEVKSTKKKQRHLRAQFDPTFKTKVTLVGGSGRGNGNGNATFAKADGAFMRQRCDRLHSQWWQPPPSLLSLPSSSYPAHPFRSFATPRSQFSIHIPLISAPFQPQLCSRLHFGSVNVNPRAGKMDRRKKTEMNERAAQGVFV